MDVRSRLERALRDTYSVERELGAGGMSLVFLATEKALSRCVVIKVLRQELSNSLSAERFRREIQLVAGLHHPHIVPVLNAGEIDGILYFTMPFVEGESLRHALRRSGELPIPQIIDILRDVCGALAYAHRQGVVHRDIKPENILLSSGGAVVTDFGIAKALVASRTEDGFFRALTEVGTPLGTPAYMAPEQSAGDPAVDHRADLYSLGVVAYELLAGRPPFQERTPQALMAAHALQEPEDIVTLRPTTLPALAAIVTRCLEKHSADRPRDAAEVLEALHEAARTPVGTYKAAARRKRPRHGNWYRRRAVVPLLAVGLAAILVSSTVRLAAERGSEPTSRRFDLILPDSAPLVFIGDADLGIGRRALALSRDGSRLAYIAGVGGSAALYLRDMASGMERRVENSTGAYQPFFSPDGQWVAFLSSNELRKANVYGGAAIPLIQVNDEADATWGHDGRIYVLAARDVPGLVWIPEAGGTPERLEITGMRFSGVSDPQYIGNGLLLLSRYHRRLIGLVDLKSRREFILSTRGLRPGDSLTASEVFGWEPTDLIRGSGPRYVSSGHIVFRSGGQEGVLQAIPFDVARRRFVGGRASVLQGVRHEAETGAGQWDAAADGTLVYAPGVTAGMSFVVSRREGTIDTLPLPPGEYGQLRLSRDGRSLMASRLAPGGGPEYWVLDMTRRVASKLNDRPPASAPISWWADSKRVVLDLGWDDSASRAAALWSPGTGDVDTVLKGAHIWEVSPDGQWVTTGPYGPSEFRHIRDSISAVPAGGFFFSFSPDNRWVALTSRVSGTSEVYVAPVPELRPRQQISVGGGEEPIWSARGDEIVYRSGERWYAVKVSTEGELSYGNPTFLFEGPYHNVAGWSHALSPDGKRHFLLLGPAERTSNRISIITNWFSDLRRLAPARTR